MNPKRIIKLGCVMIVSMLITNMGYGMHTIQFWAIIACCTVIGFPE